MKKQILILLISILLIGCNKEVLICENITTTETIETIKYINITIKEPCNVTYIEDDCQYKKSYVLDLIRRLKFLEGQQDDLIMNETECIDNNTKTNYESKLDMYERDIEELEEELENCEEEICEYNSSWC